MNAIQNYEIYNKEMSKVVIDKMFFLQHVDANIFVDYGCADGTLMKTMHKNFPHYKYIGYDIDPEMINEAVFGSDVHMIFTSEWVRVLEALTLFKAINPNSSTCLILSSIIHEVYSYCSPEMIDTFWKRVFDSGFDYIVIRDMALAPFEEYKKYLDLGDIREKADSRQLEDFENVWGNIEEKKNLIHFFLKYRYKENWIREVKENYLPLNITQIDDIFNRYCKEKYEEIFFDHFSVPFIKKQIKKDFDFILDTPTHYKLVWKRHESL